jgi:hypothetical protein
MTLTQDTVCISSQQDADHLAAKILAAVVSMKCPKASIIKARAESYGFCVELSWKETLSKDFLRFLEEDMISLLHKEEIKILEMLRDIASDFLHFHHQKRSAQRLRQWSNGLVKVIQIGSYVDLLEEELDLQKALESLKAVKLLSLTQEFKKDAQGKEKFFLSIKGISDSHPALLKDKVKEMKEALKSSHLKHTGLYTFLPSEEGEGLILSPAGRTLENQLLGLWKESFKKKHYLQVRFSDVDPKVAEKHYLSSLSSFFYESFSRMQSFSFYESGLGLYGLKSWQSLVVVKKCESKLSASSTLSLISDLKEIVDVLKLELIVSCKEEKKFQSLEELEESISTGEFKYPLSFYVKDLFERHWEIARVEIEDKKNPCYVRMHLLSVERWMALLLDLSKDSLPKSWDKS